jgi:peptide-methionine (S)-S-oxide reductase
MRRIRWTAVGIALALGTAVVVAGALLAPSRAPASRSLAAPAALAPGLAQATFAGGCFWCMETAFEKLPGVRSVISGYTGGHKKNPTYEQVSSGRTGHAESVQITYDPRVIGYPRLLEIFWHNVDPLSRDGQFCDHGRQYRSAIFYHDAEQKRLAEESKRRIEASKRFGRPIVTEIVALDVFYPAEEYHQDFYKKDPVRYQTYRLGCGRDRRLAELWGKDAAHAEAR